MVETGIHTGTYTGYRKHLGATASARSGRGERITLLVCLPLALLLWANLKCAVVHGKSMQPTFRSGQMLLVWKGVSAADLKPGDVVVFRGSDGVEMIKRIALIHRGSPWDVRRLYYTRDGTHTPEPLGIIFGTYWMGCIGDPSRLPRPDQDIYVVGDNFEDSYDSRDYGPISPRQILGKVLSWPTLSSMPPS